MLLFPTGLRGPFSFRPLHRGKVGYLLEPQLCSSLLSSLLPGLLICTYHLVLTSSVRPHRGHQLSYEICSSSWRCVLAMECAADVNDSMAAEGPVCLEHYCPELYRGFQAREDCDHCGRCPEERASPAEP